MKKTKTIIAFLLLYSIPSLCANLDSLSVRIRLDSLEKKANNLEKSIIQIKAEKHTSDLLIAIISAGGIIFSLIYTLKNILDKKESAKSAKKSEEVFEWQRASNKELLDVVKDNVNASTGMVNSITNMIDLSKMSEEMKVRLKTETTVFNNRTAELNKKSIRISNSLKRKDYYNTYFDNAIQDIHESVRLLLTSNFNEQEIDYSSSITPSAYFLTSLHFFKTYQYKDCRLWLDKTIKKASESDRQNDIIFPPEENSIISENGGIDEWVNTVINNSHFIYGLIELNQGKYKEATYQFTKATTIKKNDIESYLFNIQAQYYSEDGSFENILSSVEQLKSIINSYSKDESNLLQSFLISRVELIECYLYIPAQNNSIKNPFLSIRSKDISFKKLNELNTKPIPIDNLELLPFSYYLNSISIMFTYYQILKESLKNQQNFVNGLPRSEYEAKIKELTRKIIQYGNQFLSNIDKDNILQLFYANYILAISFEEENPNSEKNDYLLNTKLFLKMFSGMPNFKIFSPVSKAFLSYDVMQNEITELLKY